MSKIICDVCGTTYPGSSEACPICGCSRTAAEDFLGADIQFENFLGDTEQEIDTPPAANKKKEIFDFDEVNTARVPEEEYEEEDYDEEEYEEEEEQPPRHNTFVVILLTVLIVVLLGVAGFIFLRYFLPNMKSEETVPATTAVLETETTAPATEPTVPCQQMAMTNAGIAELSAEGQQFLLHIKALPENTTDKIIYTSGNDSIATVSEDGKITAVSEGETVIYISCGKHSIECPVIVKYTEETVPPTTEAAVAETAAETTDGEVTDPTAETVAEDSDAEATEPTEQISEETTPAEEEEAENPSNSNANSNVTLKLKKTDIQLGVYYQFQLVLDCDLSPEEVTWSSEHPHIATVDEQGNVTAVKAGTTAITAKYGDQEVQCLVRCIWY